MEILRQRQIEGQQLTLRVLMVLVLALAAKFGSPVVGQVVEGIGNMIEDAQTNSLQKKAFEAWKHTDRGQFEYNLTLGPHGGTLRKTPFADFEEDQYGSPPEMLDPNTPIPKAMEFNNEFGSADGSWKAIIIEDGHVVGGTPGKPSQIRFIAEKTLQN